jgi:MoxR-like ATPase
VTSSAPAQPPDERGLDAVAEIARRLVDNLETVVHGKSEEIRLVLSALVAGGHVLLEDVPGTAKTILARAIAGSVEGIQFSRIQCTPDLQPTDATGLSIFDQEHRSFVFQPGPLFANMVLVDEINRATPKTQSAMLEAMAERQVTADGVTRPLPDPFMLVATENPIEYEGTFPLPEAQLDRFFVRATLGYPGEEAELQVVREQRHGHPLDSLAPVLGLDEFVDLRRASEDVYLDDLLEEWIVRLVRSTRELEQVEVGSSVRGSLALAKTARAWALLQGRDHVLPADVVRLFIPVLGHRLVLRPVFLAETRDLTYAAALEQLRDLCLALVPPPRPDWEVPGSTPQ